MKVLRILLIAAVAYGCSGNNTSDGQPAENSSVSLVPAFDNLSFTLPLWVTISHEQSNQLFVVEQGGVILMFPNQPTVAQVDTFLDLRDRVNKVGWEEGLLGLAFHPDYPDSPYCYVNYTAAGPRRTVISRFTITDTDASIADPGSELSILEFNQPYSNHNGGCIIFGPDDYLYIGTGDGGSGGDPLESGQDRTTLLGALLRIDINIAEGGRNYGIPPDNPFVGNGEGWREEIYAYGLRNPWRFCFDPQDRLWAADVGQDAWEEIHIIEPGKNYGWDIIEGSHCFEPPDNCDKTGLEMPIWEYSHELGQSITGGYVYRGSRVPDLMGRYIYADFMSGRIWALSWDGTTASNELINNDGLSIASFAEDAAGELYICAFDGKIYVME